jgi:hypothetical protein
MLQLSNVFYYVYVKMMPMLSTNVQLHYIMTFSCPLNDKSYNKIKAYFTQIHLDSTPHNCTRTNV